MDVETGSVVVSGSGIGRGLCTWFFCGGPFWIGPGSRLGAGSVGAGIMSGIGA